MIARLLLVGALLVPVACGGDDDGVSASEYADAICSSLDEWLQSLQQQTEELQSATAKLEGDLDAAKSSIQRYIEEVVSATDVLLAKAADAGHPDVDDGEQVAAELQKGLERAKAEFEEAGEAIGAVSTEDPDEFVAAFEEIGGRLKDGSALEDAFAGLAQFGQNEELDRAFEEEAACKAISA